MIVVDSSALAAILFGESQKDAFIEAFAASLLATGEDFKKTDAALVPI